MAKVVKAKSEAKALAELADISEKRYKIAKKIYDYQDDLTKEVIDAIKDRLKVASTGVVQINGKLVKLDEQTVELSTFFLAVEIVKDLALYDIQVAGFKFNPKYCASCNKKMETKRLVRKMSKAKGKKKILQ